MTEIKTRKFRPLECYSEDVSDFYLYFVNGDRTLEQGDRVSWVGHNDQYINVQVIDRSGHARWIKMSDDQVFVCV